MTRRHRTTSSTVVLAGLLLTLGLSGCTDDESPPKASESPASPSSSSSSSFTGSDQSSTVLSASLPPAQGTSAGTIDRRSATLNVGEVRATATGTRLTFWYTGADDLLVRRGEQAWASMPTLVDPAGRKVYSPVTFVDEQGDTLCLCTDAAFIRGVPQPRTVLYPEIPAGATTVQVRQTGFAQPVSVPVTR